MANPEPPARRVAAVPRFLKAKRRLTDAAQVEADAHVRAIAENPLLGEPKTGALRGVRVVKSTVAGQQYPLAYRFVSKLNLIEVLDVAPHENVYRDRQKSRDARWVRTSMGDMMKVPLLDLRGQYEAIREDVRKAIQEVLDSQQFILGPKVRALEEALASYLGARHAIGVSSGTDALLVALWALGVGPGDAVAIPAYSFFATAGVVVRLGARPVFVDIDPATCNMDSKALEAALGRLPDAERGRVKAVIPVHLYGQCADMDALGRVAGTIPVVEDAAQAIGAQTGNGRPAGTLGALGCFSFYPTKNLGAYGDAGLVVTGDAALAERVRLLRAHGAEARYHHRSVGANFRLDALQAAVLLAKLPHLDRWTDARRERARRYDRWFAESGLTVAGRVRTPERAYAARTLARDHVYHQYVIRAERRDALRAFLTERGIGTEVYYPVPFHLQPCFGTLGHGPGAFPEAERAARETLALPIYPELTAEQQAYVVERIREFYAGVR
jgi:dTDP-4-amino-4,6-dideoxygalactose transaminase